jgi:hypothetical protein
MGDTREVFTFPRGVGWGTRSRGPVWFQGGSRGWPRFMQAGVGTQSQSVAVLVMARSRGALGRRLGGGEAAGGLGSRLYDRTLAMCRREFGAGVFVSSVEPEPAANWIPQSGDDFGSRLRHAVGHVLAAGFERVIVVGTDVPGLRAAHLRRAAARLERAPLVLGEDHAGGCWLIGLRGGHEGLLAGVEWRRDRDFAQLRGACPGASMLPGRLVDLDSIRDVPAAMSQAGVLRAWLGRMLPRFAAETARAWVRRLDPVAARRPVWPALWWCGPPALAK